MQGLWQGGQCLSHCYDSAVIWTAASHTHGGCLNHQAIEVVTESESENTMQQFRQSSFWPCLWHMYTNNTMIHCIAIWQEMSMFWQQAWLNLRSLHQTGGWGERISGVCKCVCVCVCVWRGGVGGGGGGRVCLVLSWKWNLAILCKQ